MSVYWHACSNRKLKQTGRGSLKKTREVWKIIYDEACTKYTYIFKEKKGLARVSRQKKLGQSVFSGSSCKATTKCLLSSPALPHIFFPKPCMATGWPPSTAAGSTPVPALLPRPSLNTAHRRAGATPNHPSKPVHQRILSRRACTQPLPTPLGRISLDTNSRMLPYAPI